jgi:hypothetical protein
VTREAFEQWIGNPPPPSDDKLRQASLNASSLVIRSKPLQQGSKTSEA